MQPQKDSAPGSTRFIVSNRRKPRFKIEVDISVHSRTQGVLTGRTVDISESGIAALLRIEVPLGELVELEFNLPFGPVGIYAIARQRNAFRYGFQFAESEAIHRSIRETCSHLEIERALLGDL